jgi:hypothetical protein
MNDATEVSASTQDFAAIWFTCVMFVPSVMQAMRPCREAETNREDERILLKKSFPDRILWSIQDVKAEQMACEGLDRRRERAKHF